jgi:hypothetical protein
MALVAFVLVAALQSAARAAAALLLIEHRGSVVSMSRWVGIVSFGVAACFFSMRTLAALSAAGCGLGFLAFALADGSSPAWLSLPLIAFAGALKVVSYLLVLHSVTGSGRLERAWWWSKDILVWLSLLFSSHLAVAFLNGGGAVACLLLTAVALTQRVSTSPAAPVRPRITLRLLGVACAASLALSLLMLESNQSLLVGSRAGLSAIASILAQLLLLIGLGLAALAAKQVGTLRLSGWVLLGAAPLLPWAMLVDVPVLTVASGAGHGAVAAASSLLLLALLQSLPKKWQPLAVAGWLSVPPVVEGWAAALGAALDLQAGVLSLAAVLLLLATGFSLLRASRGEGQVISISAEVAQRSGEGPSRE